MIYLNNEGNNNNQILHDENNNEKEYLVTLKEPMGKNFIHKMSNGVPILDTITKKCYVEKINDHQFKIILTQGLDRKSTRLNSSHVAISYAVFCLKKQKQNIQSQPHI